MIRATKEEKIYYTKETGDLGCLGEGLLGSWELGVKRRLIVNFFVLCSFVNEPCKRDLFLKMKF